MRIKLDENLPVDLASDPIARVRSVFQTRTAADWSGCFVVATDRKLRVRRPG